MAVVLKDILSLFTSNDTTITDKKYNYLSDVYYRNIIPYLDYEVIEITTNGYESIKIVLDCEK